jgi:hypothetical protein
VLVKTNAARLLRGAAVCLILLAASMPAHGEASASGQELGEPASSTQLLVVHGQVFRPDGFSYIEDGIGVEAINTRTGQTVTTVIGAIESHHYELVFIDPLGGAAASAGDTLAFKVERTVIYGQNGVLYLTEEHILAQMAEFDIVVDYVIGVPETHAGTWLLQNVPNPFNPSTRIRFQIAEEGPVRLDVHDARGNRIRALVAERRRPGSYSVIWDGRDSRGRDVPSGVYFVRLEAADTMRMGKMLLLR